MRFFRIAGLFAPKPHCGFCGAAGPSDRVITSRSPQTAVLFEKQYYFCDAGSNSTAGLVRGLLHRGENLYKTDRHNAIYDCRKD